MRIAARRKEKVSKEKAPPTYGPTRCAPGVRSLHRHFRGPLRRAILGPSQLSRHPCRSTPYTPIPLTLLTGLSVRANRRLLFKLGSADGSVASKRPIEEAERRCGAAGFEAGRRESSDGPWMALRNVPAELHRSEGTRRVATGRIVGQALLVTFPATGKSDPPSRAEEICQSARLPVRRSHNQSRIANPLRAAGLSPTL